MSVGYQAVFFDFDGVILDSVDVKTQAFGQMFRQYGPEVEKAVVEFHLAHGGVSRFQKFRHYYNELLNRPITDAELSELGEEFSRLALQGVLNSPFVSGALETLQRLKSLEIPCIVATGTPDDEIRMIVDSKGLGGYFYEVHGSPRKKDEIIIDVLERRQWSADRCLFIGDAMTDYWAARKVGVHFLGIVTEGQTSPFPDGVATRAAVAV